MRLLDVDRRNVYMIAAVAADWEGSVGIDADVFQLRQGDLEALSALIARYQNRLYRYLLRMVRQPQEAEDLFQQTWLRVAEKIRSYDPERNFDAWLFTLARNLSLDYLRRNRPYSLDEAAGEDAAGETMASRLASGEPAALDGLLARERSLHLTAALEELPVVYREVLTLRFEEEMKLEEIAMVLAAPLSTVKSRLRRALEQMRVILESRGSAEVWQ